MLGRLSKKRRYMMSEKKTNPEKVKRAASHPQRPGEQCKADIGAFAPVVNRARCEGKGDCVEVCPYGVFVVQVMSEGEYGELPLLSRLKSWAHGKKTAYTPNANACQACGLCVVACPEKAITLQARRL
jgi:4Fe-4S ferredoxin